MSSDGTPTSALPLGEPGIPAPGIDPPPDELAQIATVAKALAWAGGDADLERWLGTSLGGAPTMLRHVVLVDRASWDYAVEHLGNDVGAHPGPLASAKLESFRRVARLRCGLCPGDHPEAQRQREALRAAPGAPPAAALAGGGASQGAAPPGPSPSARRIKLSAVLDPTLDAEVIPICSDALKDMHNKYKISRGAEPKDG